MRWCLDLDGRQLLPLPMGAEVTLLDAADAAIVLAAYHERDAHQPR